MHRPIIAVRGRASSVWQAYCIHSIDTDNTQQITNFQFFSQKYLALLHTNTYALERTEGQGESDL